MTSLLNGEQELLSEELEMNVEKWEFTSVHAIAAEYVESHSGVVSSV